MAKLGFFKGMLRQNSAPFCGNLEGPMTKLKRGSMVVSIIDGQCIAWVVGMEDVVLSKETVKSLTYKGIQLTQFEGDNGRPARNAAIYTIEMMDGTIGSLRLDITCDEKVKQLIL